MRRRHLRSVPTGRKSEKVRYAIVGLGHISQVAMLPGFKNARRNSQLTALISESPAKLREIGRKYKVANLFAMKDLEKALKSDTFDAIYIATPNTEHQRIVEAAGKAGIHVLCEKPLAMTEQAVAAMGKTVRDSGIKFMTAYRLHFEPANLKAIEIAQGKKLGELRYFSSTFSMSVKAPNIRLQQDMGGGPLHDIGIYCINASRYLFQDEPLEVFASSATRPSDKRFEEVDEMVSVVMRFPKDRLATFTCSFGAADRGDYDLVGTKGSLRLESAFEYAGPRKMIVRIGEKEKITKFKQTDQFGPELVYFSNCILKDKTPEPGVVEGLADVIILESIFQSLEENRPVIVQSVEKRQRPSPEQEIRRPAVREPRTVDVRSPSGPH